MKLQAPWSVKQVAEKLGWSAWRTRVWLKRLHDERGLELIRSRGVNRGFKVFPAALLRVAADVFETVTNLEGRVEAIEEDARSSKECLDVLGRQTGQNTRDISALKKSQQLSLPMGRKTG